MGMNTVNLARGLMTLLNIRLSDWLPNPKYGSKWRFFRDYFPANAVCLVRELFGLLNAESARINLTDGGHIENLGMYELLKRRCRFIVAIDGEQDGNLDCPLSIKSSASRRSTSELRFTFPICMNSRRMSMAGVTCTSRWVSFVSTDDGSCGVDATADGALLRQIARTPKYRGKSPARRSLRPGRFSTRQ